jgi:hypothetical protein
MTGAASRTRSAEHHRAYVELESIASISNQHSWTDAKTG